MSRVRDRASTFEGFDGGTLRFIAVVGAVAAVVDDDPCRRDPAPDRCDRVVVGFIVHSLRRS